MYKFILVLAIASSSAFASSNILPETKNARKPASDSPPPIDQIRILLVDRTFQRSVDWGNGRGVIPLRVEKCSSPVPKSDPNAQGAQGGVVIGDLFIGAKVYPPAGEIGPECYTTVSSAASTKAYIDYIENQLAQKLDLYIKALDQKASEKFEQRLNDPSCQERLQKEAIRILEANAAIRNQ